MHGWLDRAVNAWMKENGAEKFLTETELSFNEFVEGHSDLYSKDDAAVIDWKSAGPDVMKKVKKEGPSAGYQIQTHIYGLMFEQRGYPVRKVSLVFLPRAGRLWDMYVWSADYDRNVAISAMDRMYRIAQQIVSMDILNQSHLWEQVDPVFSNSCGFCPMYDPGRDPERGADDTGCPGR